MILDIAARRAELHPARPAVWWRERWLDYGELNRRATRLAGRLLAEGVRKGDRVSILALNHLAHLDLILATAKLGHVYTPLNFRLAAAEQRAITGYVRPRLLLADARHAETAASLGVPLVELEHYEEWLGDPEPAPAPELGPEDVQMILFTGGTTGLPKGAMLPYRQGFFNAVNTVLSWGLRDDDAVVQATPCFHAAVNAFTVPLLHLGGRVILMEAFDPDEYLRLVEEAEATLLFLVPTMYKMIADAPGFRTADLSGVRWAISGGAPCPEPVREAFADRGVRFKQGYGLTEAGVNCFAIALEDAQERPASVGKPVLHAAAAVRRPDGTVAERGEVGELTLSGPHLFSGYFERPVETQAVLRDGWLWTGDLARQDDDGFFYIVGRSKEMFISGGENIYPVEIENVLYEHPAVSECAVVGVPDDRWGEVGLAVVVLKEDAAGGSSATPFGGGPDRDDMVAELDRHLRERLARFKVPRHLRIVGSLPKSGAGKILKNELRDAYLEDAHAAG